MRTKHHDICWRNLVQYIVSGGQSRENYDAMMAPRKMQCEDGRWLKLAQNYVQLGVFRIGDVEAYGSPSDELHSHLRVAKQTICVVQYLTAQDNP
jgi:hypothetical protein